MTKSIRNISDIARAMESQLLKDGITAEVTFARADMLSVLVDDLNQFHRMIYVMSLISTATFISSEEDDELGNIAYYKF